jgi:hypothetical protein
MTQKQGWLVAIGILAVALIMALIGGGLSPVLDLIVPLGLGLVWYFVVIKNMLPASV